MALSNTHPEGFGPSKVLEAVAAIDSEQAEATKLQDKIRISRAIAVSVKGGVQVRTVPQFRIVSQRSSTV
jgi:hypothetical protein